MGGVGTPLMIKTIDQDRAERCLAEVQKILRNYNCQILPQITFVGNQVANSGFMVVATPAVPGDLRGEKARDNGR